MAKRLNRAKLVTEQQNPASLNLDSQPVSRILKIINEEDSTIASAVNKVLPQVEQVVELAIDTIRRNNHLIYVGAGTSGRLGVLDASECPPTFSVPPKFFKAVIAGGDQALRQSVEGSEDHPENAETDLKSVGIMAGDLVIGIASSGATPYVLHALNYARERGCSTVFLICNVSPIIQMDVDVLIAVEVGQEVITGSTRMKSGTATKMILNMISTATMVRLGKVYGNLMVDLKAVNDKLNDRGTRIVANLTGLEYEPANELFLKADKEVKTAVTMHHRKCDADSARSLLTELGGFLRAVIEN